MASEEPARPPESSNTLLSILADEPIRSASTSAISPPPVAVVQRAPSPAQALSAPDSEPLRKRPRVGQACEACRDRKTRCGGERPVCHACERRGVSALCTYDRNTYSGTKRKAVSLGQPDEQRLMSTPAHVYAKRDPQSVPQPAPSISFSAINGSQRLPSLTDTRSNVVVSPILRARAASIEGHKTEHNSVYGPTSTIAFLNTISDEPVSVNEAQPLVLGQKNPPNARVAFKPPEKMFATDGNATMLPRRRDADDYVRCFWECLHPLFPVLHKPSFMNHYELLWKADTDAEPNEFDENMFMSAINIVFAIGCKFSKLVPNDHKSSLADEFYQRSRRTFCYDVLDTASLSMIQLLLLQVAYLQSTHHAVRCWNAIGLAVRASQSAGLHLQLDSDRHRSQMQIEMRRRIYHSCVSLDRLIAVVFGRSATIKQTPNIPLPSLIDDEFIGDDFVGVQPQGRLPQLGLFNHSCKLFDILEDVLATFYSGQSTLRARDMDQAHLVLVTVLDLNKRIDNLVAERPSWLEEITPAADAHVRQQQSVMRMRTSYVRLLALKPLLMLVSNKKLNASSRTLDQELIRQCCMRGLATAQSLVHITYTHLQELYQPTPWHLTLATCAALMVFLAAIKSGLVSWEDRELQVAWDEAIGVLEYYQDQVSTAAEGIRVLQTLKRQQRSPQRQLPGQSYAHDGVKPDSAAEHRNGTMPTPQSVPQDDFDVSDLNFSFDDLTDSWFSEHFLDTHWPGMATA